MMTRESVAIIGHIAVTFATNVHTNVQTIKKQMMLPNAKQVTSCPYSRRQSHFSPARNQTDLSGTYVL